MPIFLSEIIFLFEYCLIWKWTLIGYPVFYGHSKLSLCSTENPHEWKIFTTRKSPFAAVSQILISLNSTFLRKYRMERQYLELLVATDICRCYETIPFHVHMIFMQEEAPRIFTGQLKKGYCCISRSCYEQTFCEYITSKILTHDQQLSREQIAAINNNINNVFIDDKIRNKHFLIEKII